MQKTEAFRSEMSIFTSRAVDALKEGMPGDAITREQMGTIVGRDCDTGSAGYGNVQSAIRHVRRNYAREWAWDGDLKAWRCLTEPEKVSREVGHLNRSRRAAKRSLEVAAIVDVKSLDQERLREHNLNTAQAAMVHLSTGAPFRKRLEQQSHGGTFKQPSADKVIELMK